MPNTPSMDMINADITSAGILVVDDELANVKLVEGMFKAHGYTNIITTTDSREVLSLYQNNHIDIILLDLNMPYMDGYDVMAQLIKEYGKSLAPVLILTAQVSAEFKNRAFENGARDYVTKPFDIKEVLSRARNLIEGQLFHQHLKKQNEVLEQKVQARTKEIYDTRLEIVRCLGRAAEYRDNETGLHIVRMSKFAELLGRAYGIGEHQCELLLNASPMHDIGKIGIPDHVLLKPGKFEPDEWEIMKTHAAIGANILSGSDSELLNMAKEIALSHHEKWDGSGYPAGLAGEDIPLVGRITAIADVFDALTSERPYKKAWTVEDAVKLINEQSGIHFEPKMVELFNDLLPEFCAIRDQFSEPKEA
ncbi:MAG: response regulator [Gammaproteobacteria bacterium]|nr:response regulator [Gammaproteobacteria bacterium]